MRTIPRGTYLVKVTAKKDGTLDAEVVGRWAPFQIKERGVTHVGEQLVKPSATATRLLRGWIRLYK